MMQSQTNSVCIRCGKVRVLLRRWEEKPNGRGSPIIHEETVCPDKECQKIVDEKFQKMRDLREASENRKKSITISKN